MISENYIRAIGRIFWGYIFIYFNLNLGSLDVFPGWIGFLLIYSALPEIAEYESSAKLLRIFALLLAANEFFVWTSGAFTLFGGEDGMYWINLFASIISLYFHFQLLTNLAQIAESQGSFRAETFRKLRTIQTIYLTVWALLPAEYIVQRYGYEVNSILALVFIAIPIVVMILLVVSIHGYKKELRNMNDINFKTKL